MLKNLSETSLGILAVLGIVRDSRTYFLRFLFHNGQRLASWLLGGICIRFLRFNLSQAQANLLHQVWSTTRLSSLFRVAVRNLFPRLSRERRSMTARSKSDQFVPHILKLSHDDRSSQTADRSDDQRCKRMPLPVSTSHMSSRTTLMRASAFPDVRKSLAGWMAEFLMMIANRATHPSGE